MVKDDVIKAQEIVKTNLVSNVPFHENSFIYRATNEKIDNYQLFLRNRENVLSVISSGNQILNTIYEGGKNITGFDISTFPKYYLELQIAALNTFGLDDYIKFIYEDIDDEKFDDMYDALHPILEKDSKIFWDGLLNSFDISEIINSTLFSNETINLRNVITRNAYLHSEEDYQKLRGSMQQANLKYITGDIFSLGEQLDDNYDFINLSSIIYYKKINEYQNMLEKLPLTDNGEALTYLYNVKMLIAEREHLPNCSFYNFSDNRSGVMIYKKSK